MQILFYVMLVLVGQYVGQDEYLKNIQHYWVVVNVASSCPISETRVKTDIELRLRSLGIQISQDDKVIQELNVSLQCISDSDSSETALAYAYTIGIDFRAPVTLASGKKAMATVWDCGSIGLAGASKIKSQLRESDKNQVDRFANAWLKTHPTKSGKNKIRE